jgi:hypothetical protein
MRAKAELLLADEVLEDNTSCIHILIAHFTNLADQLNYTMKDPESFKGSPTVIFHALHCTIGNENVYVVAVKFDFRTIPKEQRAT